MIFHIVIDSKQGKNAICFVKFISGLMESVCLK